MENNNNSNDPIILGTLRKEKSSKPVFVFIVLVMILGITFSLPYLENYIKDPNTFLGGIYSSIFGVPEDDEEKIIITNDSMHILNDKTSINYNTILLTNISLVNNSITYHIKTKNNTVNLDEGNYYLEIYGGTSNLLERIKLTGVLTTTEEKRTFIFNDLKFNPSSSYYGRIQELKNENYPALTLTSDESGIASLVCTVTGNKYEYIFDNYKLKSIRHEFMYNDTKDINVYLNAYQKYSNNSAIINNLNKESSKTEETNQGFKFTANLDLNIINKNNLETANDIHYYNLDKEAKIIAYDMKVQGFTCK